MADVTTRGEVIVTLSKQEVIDAIEHAAWIAALQDEPGLAVTGDGRIVSYGEGYRVIFTRKD